MTELRGDRVVLRTATVADGARIIAIQSTPEVQARWGNVEDLRAEFAADLVDDALELLVVEFEGRIVGGIQWSAEEERDYRHASIDVYLEAAVHGHGLGTDAVRTLARHLITDRGYHRITIDPAADNAAAIRCYEKVGFRPVGIMREYERGRDGSWHDGLLMDLLAREITPGP